ncbi:MAG: hypothetical protein ACHQ50_04815 [Fimbriimonadales bacterium]
MKSPTAIEAIVNTPNMVALNRVRTMFQRVSDARFFNGWVVRIMPDSVVAHTQTNCDLKPGDAFSFQVFGNKQDAFFLASLISVQRAELGYAVAGGRSPDRHGLELVCQVTTKVRLKDCKEQPRFFVDGVIADITCADGTRSEGATVIDVGAGGFAAVTGRTMAKGDRVEISLYGNGLFIQCVAEVRNSIVCGASSDFQRTGFQSSRSTA